MVNRVVLGAFDSTFVLRASRPGFNVLTTTLTPEQTAFDSRWADAANVYASGITRGSCFMGNLVAAVSCTIQAPAGLPYPPIVRSLLKHESRNEFMHGEYGGQAGAVVYDKASGSYLLQTTPAWSTGQSSGTFPWGYFYWIILRS